MRYTFASFVLLAAVLLSANAFAQDSAEHAHHAPLPGAGLIDAIEVDFELLDAEGQVVGDEAFRGRFVLLAFGFTRCDTVCPILAWTMGQALERAQEDAIGIFVSVDTERDTPQTTHRYASGFSERMIGLGGDYARINKVTDNFNVNYAVTKTRDSYVVQHSANIFLIGPDGELREVFAVNSTAESILAAMR